MFALSILIGFYYIRKNGLKKGFDDDALFMLVIIIVAAAVVGARALFVAANWPFFAEKPELIIRIDRGGLAFHGGLLTAVLASWIYCRCRQLSWPVLADLAVPGIAVGIFLVRLANIFNQEILGREAYLLPFDRHPTQIYGALIGIILLIFHNHLVRKGVPGPGYLFWAFVFGYSLLRGFIEETFRENPLLIWGYVSEAWGFGLFTAVHLFTPVMLILTYYMMFLVRRR